MKLKLILGLVLLVVLSINASAALTDNINAYWHFNNATDPVGGRNLSTNTSATYGTPAKIPNAGIFDGTKYFYYTYTDALGVTNNWTLCLWANLTYNNSQQFLYSESRNGAQRLVIAQQNVNTTAYQFVTSWYGTLDRALGPSSSVLFGQYYFFCWVRDGVNEKYYINAVSDTTGTTNAQNITTTAAENPTFGKRAYSTGGFMYGQLDEFGAWTRALNQTEITQLYNSGAGLTYPFAGAPVTGNFSITAISNYTAAAINTFNASIFLDNGTTQEYTTTGGQIDTTIPNTYAGLANITIVSPDRFTYVRNEVNISSNLQANLIQAQINISPKAKVTDAVLSGTVTLNGVSQSSPAIFFPDSGTYSLNVSATGYYTNNTNITISALDNTTLLVPVANSIMNITARDNITSAVINTFNVTVSNSTYSYTEQASTTNGQIYINLTQGVNYTIQITAPGYGSNFTTKYSVPSANTANITFSLVTENTVLVNVYNITNNVLVTSPAIVLSGVGVPSYSASPANGSYYFTNLTSGSYDVDVSRAGFAAGRYFVVVGNGTFQILNVYLLAEAGQTVTLKVYDAVNANTIQGAVVSVEARINGSYVLVQSLESDIAGEVTFDYQASTAYRITVTATDYDTKTFVLNPIIANTYNVYMDRSTSSANNYDYEEIGITWTPNSLINNATNNISFTFSNPTGRLIAYGFNITFNGVTASNTGSNAYGSNINTSILIENATFQDTALVTYYYQYSNFTRNVYSFEMPIATDAPDYTLKGNEGRTYGLGLLERILIVVGTVIVLAGFAYLAGGLIASGVVAMLFFGWFMYIGFITPWIIIPSMVVLFLIIVRSSTR